MTKISHIQKLKYEDLPSQTDFHLCVSSIKSIVQHNVV